MDVLRTEDKPWWAGVALVALAALCLLISSTGIPTIYGIRNRRASTSHTPPRSISPEKKKPSQQNTTATPVYVLPPQRRHALAAIGLPYKEVPEDEVRQRILPMIEAYRDCEEERYTPTGFSVADVKALGDFPDYATLSGVPLPEAYDRFDIERALPRPYRPFRWSYHQTMCMFHRPSFNL